MTQDVDEWIQSVSDDQRGTVQAMVVEAVFEAVTCLWQQGGAYVDLKPANVMVKIDENAQAEIKLFDLASICEANSVDGKSTFPPPSTWKITQEKGDYKDADLGVTEDRKVPCTAVTVLWQLAVFYLCIYLKADQVYKVQEWLGWASKDSLCRADLLRVNSTFAKIDSLCTACPDSPLLQLVHWCFAPIVSGTDWRITGNSKSLKNQLRFSACLGCFEHIERTFNMYW